MKLISIFTVLVFSFSAWSMQPPAPREQVSEMLNKLVENNPKLKLRIETWSDREKVKNYYYNSHSFKGYEYLLESIFSEFKLRPDSEFQGFSPKHLYLILSFEKDGIILKKLFEYLQKNSESNPEVQYLLGFAYRMGKGVPKSSELARECYYSAAKAGSYIAMLNYWEVIASSRVILEQNQAREAFEFLEHAAEKIPQAMYRLSLLKFALYYGSPYKFGESDLYSLNESAMKNIAQGSSRLSRPKATKDQRPQSSPAIKQLVQEQALNQPKYIPHDEVVESVESVPVVSHASKEFEESVGLQFGEVKRYAEYKQVKDWTPEQHKENLKNAITLLHKAASHSYGKAQYQFYMRAKDLSLTRFRDEAIQFLKRAAERGDEDAQEDIANAYGAFSYRHNGMFKIDGIEPNEWSAARYNLAFARRNDSYSMGVIGEMLVKGEVFERNPEDGMFLLNIAFNDRCPNAIYYFMKKYLSEPVDKEKALDCAKKLQYRYIVDHKRPIYKNEVSEANRLLTE